MEKVALYPLALLGVGSLYAITRFARAMRCKCDLATAYAKLPPSSYKGKVVWITGASSGLGAEFAKQLGALGAKLILSARTTSALEALRDEIVAAGAAKADIAILPLDVSELKALPAAAEKACAFFGGVDVLVNNAGLSQREISASTDFDVTEHMTTVDYLSCACLAKSLLEPMEARGGGRFINISSVAGKVGVPLRTSYCGAKFALIGYFDALRAEEYARGSGIAVTNACPGSVRTNVARNAVLGKKGVLRGESDPNIENGLDPVWVCERILAAAASDVDEVWIAGPRELFITYASQYLPAWAKGKLKQNAASMMKATLVSMDEKKGQ